MSEVDEAICGRCCYAGTATCGYYTDGHGSWFPLKHDEQGRGVRNDRCRLNGRPLGSLMLDDERSRMAEVFEAAVKRVYDGGLPVCEGPSCPTCRPRVPPRKDDQKNE